MNTIPPFALMPFLTFADTVFLRGASCGCRQHFKSAIMMAIAKGRLVECLGSAAVRIINAMKAEGLSLWGLKVLTVLLDMPTPIFPAALFYCSEIPDAVETQNSENPVVQHQLGDVAIVHRKRASPLRIGQIGEHAIFTNPFRSSCDKNSIRFVGSGFNRNQLVIEISDRNTLSKIFTVCGVSMTTVDEVNAEISRREMLGFTFLRSSFMDYCSWEKSPASLVIQDVLYRFMGGVGLDCGKADCRIHIRHIQTSAAIRVMLRNAAS